MKKLQRRQQQSNGNDASEKKSKKKTKGDARSTQYIFDDEGENIGKVASPFHLSTKKALTRFLEGGVATSPISL